MSLRFNKLLLEGSGQRRDLGPWSREWRRREMSKRNGSTPLNCIHDVAHAGYGNHWRRPGHFDDGNQTEV
jgi:hypothetical protein